MTVLITYDIERTTSTIHTEVKDAMKANGYSDSVPLVGGGKVSLPNTTLIKDNITPETAQTDIKAVCRAKGAVLERYIALQVQIEGGRAESFKLRL